nr:hypothetical protein [Prochlorococcus marinus]
MIGYLPYSPDLSSTGDRRRFLWFCKEKKIKFEIANYHKEYKIIYAVYGSNLSQLIEYKKKFPKTKIIFEIVDAHLEEKNLFIVYFRGLLRFLLGKEKTFYLNYNNLIKKMIRISEVVVCSTKYQKSYLKKLNKNIIISLDYIEDDFSKVISKIKETTKKIDVFWEGKAWSLKHLKILNNFSRELKQKIHIHILTDLSTEVIPNLYHLKAKKISRSFKFNFTLYQWDKKLVKKISNLCQIGIIPILENDKVAQSKPENKLILMWTLGLPVFTSNTKAYSFAMGKLNKKYICKDKKNWEKNLNYYFEKSNNEKKKDFIEIENILLKKYSKDKYLEVWERIFKLCKSK